MPWLTPTQVDSPNSLENVQTKWVGEIAENCQGAKLVLCALKCDLREKPTEEEIAADPTTARKEALTYENGVETAKKIGAVRYLGTCYSVPVLLRSNLWMLDASLSLEDTQRGMMS